MDGWLVSNPPSNNNEGAGGGHRPSPRFACTDKFEQYFSYYLAIGMTPEQYWEQDSTLVVNYRKAAQIKQNLQNQAAWLQGAYIYEALVDVSPAFRSMGAKKPSPYMKEPFDLNTRTDLKHKAEVEQKHDDKAKAYMEIFAMANNKKFEKKGGGVDG